MDPSLNYFLQVYEYQKILVLCFTLYETFHFLCFLKTKITLWHKNHGIVSGVPQIKRKGTLVTFKRQETKLTDEGMGPSEDK